MKVINVNKFKGLKLVKGKTFKDNRGIFRELFIEKILKKKFLFSYISKSKKNVVRGFHFQQKKEQGKLICVLKGAALDIALDLRKNSKTFGKYFSTILSDKNSMSLYIPEGFAHAFCALENDTIMLYKCTNYRAKKYERGILWNDKLINVKWPAKKTILSNKDKKNMSFSHFLKNYIKK